MKRLYRLLPDVAHCESQINSLISMGVSPAHLHVVAGLDQPLETLPVARIWQRTELAHGIEQGLAFGGVAGLLGGLLALSFPPAGLVLGGGAVALSALAGAGLGGVIQALLASHEPNHRLDDYVAAIDEGQVLLLVDVPRARVPEIAALLQEAAAPAGVGALGAGL